MSRNGYVDLPLADQLIHNQISNIYIMSFSKEPKQIERIQFAYYASAKGPMGDVFRYLLRNRAHTTHKGKKMGLAAISAYWKPFSAYSVLNLSDREVQAVSLNSIAELEEQIRLIQTTFNIQAQQPEPTRIMTRADIAQMVEEVLVQRLGYQGTRHSALPLPDSYNIRG